MRDQPIADISGEVLLIPQFTLYGKVEKGRRPDFTDALEPALAKPAFTRFENVMRSHLSEHVQAGVFGADMHIALINNGPITLNLEW